MVIGAMTLSCSPLTCDLAFLKLVVLNPNPGAPERWRAPRGKARWVGDAPCGLSVPLASGPPWRLPES